MLSTGLANYMFSTFLLSVLAYALHSPLSLGRLCSITVTLLFALLLTDHLLVCKNNSFAYQLSADSVNFAVTEKEMQSVSLICTEGK